MVREGRGTLRQDFRIHLDIEKLIDYVVDSVIKEISADIEDVDLDEWITDGMSLEIMGTYSSPFKSWWCSATLESPEEYDIDRKYIGEVTLSELPEEIKKLVSVIEVEEDEDNVEYPEPYEPDEDSIYDAWKDRQLEGDY